MKCLAGHVHIPKENADGSSQGLSHLSHKMSRLWGR